MKTKFIPIILGLATLAACTDADPAVEFGVDEKNIAMGADGGTHTIKIDSPESWIALTDDPWISVSPANGRGSTECKIIIDSALTDTPRRGLVRIQTQTSLKDTQIEIEQQGYEYTVEVSENSITVPNYAAYGQRYFDVTIKSNTEFDVVVPDDAGWLTFDRPRFNLNRGSRPREVTVRFNWQISSQPERIAAVTFKPAKETSRLDNLTVIQEAAPAIEADTRAGDSVALLGIARALDTWYSWESPDPMDRWSDVELWEEGMEGWTPEKNGRVKKADFFLFATREGLPYEVQYLTAAEELIFRGNENSFLYNLDPGEYITKLKNLKRLTMQGYGLTELNDAMVEMESLEYLDIAANNFERFPTILRQENFPKLKSLVMNANQRNLVYDLSNDSRNNLGGFYSSSGPDAEFPRWLLEWDSLEELSLGVNYIQGSFPKLEDDPTWTSFYEESEVSLVDSLPNGSFAEKNPDGSPKGVVGMPKVWPKMRRFTINYNRMTGSVPDWLLYHPALDWWIPFTFLFNQEGKDETGRIAGFDNEPKTTMDYYYQFYTTKRNPYADAEGEQEGEEENSGK